MKQSTKFEFFTIWGILLIQIIRRRHFQAKAPSNGIPISILCYFEFPQPHFNKLNMTDEALLLCGVVFSSIGFGFFVYGKKQHRLIPLISGLALMVLPYFVDSVSLLIGAGIALMALPYFVRQ